MCHGPQLCAEAAGRTCRAKCAGAAPEVCAGGTAGTTATCTTAGAAFAAASAMKWGPRAGAGAEGRPGPGLGLGLGFHAPGLQAGSRTRSKRAAELSARAAHRVRDENRACDGRSYMDCRTTRTTIW